MPDSDIRDEYVKRVKYVAQKTKENNEKPPKDSGGAASASSPIGTTNSGTWEPIVIPGVSLPIKLTTESRHNYQEKARAYAQSIDITKSPDFAKINLAKWDVRGPRFTGEGYVRKDFAYYLDVLHDQVAPKLGVKKLFIGSSFRSNSWNVNHVYAGKSPVVVNSPHCCGLAVDICVTGNDRYILADTAWNMGFGGIAVGSDFVHIDLSGRATWDYPPVPEYKGPGHWYGK